MIRGLCLSVALVVSFLTAAIAADLTPSDLLANPSTYEGKTVTVAGKVANFQTTHTFMGTVSGFQLCDAKCIVVIDQKNSERSNGEHATVTGTFYKTFKARKRSFNNAVVIK